MSSVEWAVDERVIARLFAKLLVRYGSVWTRRFELVPEDALAADWKAELQGVSRDQMAFAVANLPPEFPPDAGAFKALCRQFRTYDQTPALTAPSGDPTVRAKTLEKLRSMRIGSNDPQAWIGERLKAHGPNDPWARQAIANLGLRYRGER